MALHLAVEYFAMQQSAWLTQWLQSAQIQWLDNKPKSFPFTTAQAVGMICLCWFGFLWTWGYELRTNIPTLVLFVQKALFMCFVQLCKPSCVAVFFLEMGGFLLEILPTIHTVSQGIAWSDSWENWWTCVVLLMWVQLGFCCVIFLLLPYVMFTLTPVHLGFLSCFPSLTFGSHSACYTAEPRR